MSGPGADGPWRPEPEVLKGACLLPACYCAEALSNCGCRKQELLQAISARDPESQLSEALLMLRVFFRANCQSQAELLLRQLIGLDITLSPKMILQIRFLFSKDSCKDYYLASQALGIKKVPDPFAHAENAS